jgi:hypothetical protein
VRQDTGFPSREMNGRHWILKKFLIYNLIEFVDAIFFFKSLIITYDKFIIDFCTIKISFNFSS